MNLVPLIKLKKYWWTMRFRKCVGGRVAARKPTNKFTPRIPFDPSKLQYSISIFSSTKIDAFPWKFAVWMVLNKPWNQRKTYAEQAQGEAKEKSIYFGGGFYSRFIHKFYMYYLMYSHLPNNFYNTQVQQLLFDDNRSWSIILGT